MGEFLKIYGMRDIPEVRNVVWAELLDIFGDVPVNELRANTPIEPPRKKSVLP
jgi:hypothetical protein